MARPRYSLVFGQWPEADRQALQRAFEQGGPFDESGHAAHWAAQTRKSIVKNYGQWLHYLGRIGCLDSKLSPAGRVSEGLLSEYVRDLQTRVAPVTVATLIRGLAEALRVMDPSADRRQIQQASRRLRHNAKPSRDKRQKLVAPSRLYYAGIARMERFGSDAMQDALASVQFGDGLMMCMLAAKPVRRKNLVGSRVGEHVLKTPCGGYEWRFRSEETKTRERILAELPATLTPYIDKWHETIRPLLLGARQSSAMWLTTKGADMATDTVYGRFCRATEEELGVRLTPHLVRDIVATGIAAEMPEAVQITPMLLDHRTDETARKYYNLADQLSASARYLGHLELLRRGAFCRARAAIPARNSRGFKTGASR